MKIEYCCVDWIDFDQILIHFNIYYWGYSALLEYYFTTARDNKWIEIISTQLNLYLS